MKLKNIHLIISLVSIILFFGCSKVNGPDNKTSEETGIAEQSTVIYPHSDVWKSEHMAYIASNKFAGVEESCSQCHQKNNLGAAREVNCTTKCHSTENRIPVPASDPVLLPNRCTNCHSTIVKNKFAHYPSNAGLCTTCHQVSEKHMRGESDPVKTRNTDTDCYRCHKRKDTDPVIHGALKDEKSCISCHNPHGGEQRFYIKADSNKNLCLGCHDTPVDAAVKHGPAINKKSCLNCHTPHSSKNKNLLLLPSRELCLNCHDQEISTTLNGSRVIPNIRAKLEQTTNQHSGAMMGDCSTCHTPHGSKFNRLLNASYSLSNYNTFSEGAYALCFNCHDSKAFNSKNLTDTGFRDNNKNYHWYHVVDAAGAQDKSTGRSCRICHDPHGSNQDFSINQSWNMSGYQINISYTRTKNGGQCTLTCHDLRTYSR